MQAAEIYQQVRQFIVENYFFGQDRKLDERDSFLEQGIIDSTGVLELVAFLQDTFGITVEDEEITPDNLDSVSNVTAYLQRKLDGTPDLATAQSGGKEGIA